VLNRDILSLPERERQAWVHGAMAQMAQTLAGRDRVTAKCILDWYFEIGNGAETTPKIMAHFPEKTATATIISLARRACPNV